MNRPTIIDVARLAGVSRGTVSRVLNGSPKVSPAARRAVEKAIVESGYRTNLHARSLASGRANAIGVLLTQPQRELFEDPTFNLLLQGVSHGLADSDTALVLLLAGNEQERSRTARFVTSAAIDGVIHLSPHLNDPLLDALLIAQLPVVMCSEPSPGFTHPKLRSVTVTDKVGAVAAVEHLQKRGAKRIAMVAGPTDAVGSIERLQGFRQVLGADLDENLIVHGDYGRESGRLAFEELLTRGSFDAVFCASDRMAAGVYDVAADRGIAIPDDLLVIGFDGHAIGEDLDPQLTTVRQPLLDLGRAAVHMLGELAQGRDPGNRVFPTELVIRASA